MLKSDAIEYFGSTRSLAEILDVSTQAIYNWGDEVPEMQAYKLQVLTEGKLTAEEQLGMDLNATHTNTLLNSKKG